VLQRFQQISDIVEDLKITARMLKTPIIIAAQTNRSGDKDGADLGNVAESIAISQTSDVVIGLYQDADMEHDGEMEIRVNKNRGGKRPTLRAIWDHEKPEFREKTGRDMLRGGQNGRQQ
jgi:replicative DNA helicase